MTVIMAHSTRCKLR